VEGLQMQLNQKEQIIQEQNRKMLRLETKVQELENAWKKLDTTIAEKREDFLPPNHNRGPAKKQN